MRLMFQHSPDHNLAKQIISEIASGQSTLDEDRALRENFDEITAYVTREEHSFLRGATHAERRVFKSFLRKVVTAAFPELMRDRSPRFGQFGPSQLRAFRDTGSVSFGRYIDRATCHSLREAVSSLPVFNAHIAVVSDGIPRRCEDSLDPAEKFQFGSYAEDTIATLPYIGAFVFNEKLLAFLTAYFGVPPVLRDLHLWWSFPQSTKFGPFAHAGQQFHRDFRALQDVQFFA
jgi:hypothetical protein